MKTVSPSAWRLVRSLLSLLVGVRTVAADAGVDVTLNIVWLAPLHTVDDGIWASFNASSSMAGLAMAIDRVRQENIMQGMKFK